MTLTEKHIIGMFTVFAFDFETCIKAILSLISRLINEALLVADHISIRCCLSSLTSLTVSDKHVPACRFQSVSPGAGALVLFSCKKWVKVNRYAASRQTRPHDSRLLRIIQEYVYQKQQGRQTSLMSSGY